MALYKHYDYNQTRLIPVDFSNQIIEGTFEHTLNIIIDHHTDLSVFDNKYKNDETGAPAWDPAIMLKIILFAYYNGIVSSRGIQAACKENIIFMSLSCCSNRHYTTIAKFIREMTNEALTIFRNTLLVSSQLNLKGNETFALDGDRLPANVSKEWTGTFKNLKKKKEKFEATIKLLIEEYKKMIEKKKKTFSEKGSIWSKLRK